MWTGCVAEQHKDTEESRDGMETPTPIVSFRNKNPPRTEAASGPGLVHEGPQSPAGPQEDSFIQTRTERLKTRRAAGRSCYPKPRITKQSRAWGSTHTHTLTPTPTPPPPPESSLLTARTQPPSPSPAASLSNRRGEPRTAAETNKDPGGGTSGFQQHPGRRGASVRRGGCSDGCGRSVGRTGTFFFFFFVLLFFTSTKTETT